MRNLNSHGHSYNCINWSSSSSKFLNLWVCSFIVSCPTPSLSNKLTTLKSSLRSSEATVEIRKIKFIFENSMKERYKTEVVWDVTADLQLVKSFTSRFLSSEVSPSPSSQVYSNSQFMINFEYVIMIKIMIWFEWIPKVNFTSAHKLAYIQFKNIKFR